MKRPWNASRALRRITLKAMSERTKHLFRVSKCLCYADRSVFESCAQLGASRKKRKVANAQRSCNRVLPSAIHSSEEKRAGSATSRSLAVWGLRTRVKLKHVKRVRSPWYRGSCPCDHQMSFRRQPRVDWLQTVFGIDCRYPSYDILASLFAWIITAWASWAHQPW